MIFNDDTKLADSEGAVDAGSVKVDPTKAKEIQKFTHTRPLTTCRVDPSGKYAFVGAEDYGIYRFDLETGDKVAYLGHDSWVRRFDFSADGKTLLSSGWDGRIGFWDVEPVEITEVEITAAIEKTEKEEAKPAVMQLQVAATKMVEAHQGFSRWVHVAPDGKTIATCGNDKLVKVWSAKKMKLRRHCVGHERHPWAVMIHPNGQELVSEDIMGEIIVWGLKDGKQRSKIDASVMTGFDLKFQADMGGARAMAFNQDGSLLGCAGTTNVVNAFAGQQDPIICVIDWETKEITHHLRTKDNKPGIEWGVHFHEDGFVVGCFAGQSDSGTVEFWRLDEPAVVKPEAKPEAKPEGATDADVDKSESETAEVEKAKPVEQKPFHVVKIDRAVRGIDFTSDGRRFAIACADGSLRVYEF
jgi:WD40 repeat protein